MAIIEDEVSGDVLAWRPAKKREYRAALDWITETGWACQCLGWGRAAGRIISDAKAVEMLAAGKFRGKNLYHAPCAEIFRKSS